jgi:hypothetical protein
MSLARRLLGSLLMFFAAVGAPPAGSAAEQPRVATFRCDVTPPLGQPIYSSYKPLAEVEHPLLAKGIVLEDREGGRYVICAVDYCEIANSTHRMFVEKLAEAAGTRPGRVAVQTVHQHTAPMACGDAYRLAAAVEEPPPHPKADAFDPMADRVAEAVKAACERLAPFDRVGFGQAKVERVASARRLISEDGKLRTRFSRCTNPQLRAAPEGRIDPWLKTVTLARGGDPLVRMHYYATHPQSFYGDPRASYDFPGMAREQLEEAEGVPQIYFTGCAGDVTAGKYNDGSREARRQLAERLHAGMKAAAAATEFKEAGQIVWREVDLTLPLRTDPGHTRADCEARMNDLQETGLMRIFRGAMPLAFADRHERPIPLCSLQLGELFILHLPGECMIEYQLYAQSLRPDAPVVVAAYGDCGAGYICTEAAFAEGGYEPSASRVAPESEPLLKTAIRELLGLE